MICKYQQVNEHQECFDIDSVPIPLPKPVWRDFDVSGMTVEHFLNLTVGGKTAVVLRIGNAVISNSATVRQQYHKTSAKEKLMVLDLAKISPVTGLVRYWHP